MLRRAVRCCVCTQAKSGGAKPFRSVSLEGFTLSLTHHDHHHHLPTPSQPSVEHTHPTPIEGLTSHRKRRDQLLCLTDRSNCICSPGLNRVDFGAKAQLISLKRGAEAKTCPGSRHSGIDGRMRPTVDLARGPVMALFAELRSYGVGRGTSHPAFRILHITSPRTDTLALMFSSVLGTTDYKSCYHAPPSQ